MRGMGRILAAFLRWVRHDRGAQPGMGCEHAVGYPGVSGIGAVTAARLLNQHGRIEDFPPELLAGERRDLALLFKDLATLGTDAPLFRDVDELRWRGPTKEFAAWAEDMDAPRLLDRSRRAAHRGEEG